MGIKYEKLEVVTTGDAGAATGSADSSPILGRLLSVILREHDDLPGTTTGTLVEVDGPQRTLLTFEAGEVIDTEYALRLPVVDVAGEVIAGLAEPAVLLGNKVRLSLDLSDALEPAVTAWLIWE